MPMVGHGLLNMTTPNITFSKSNGQAFIISPAQARQTQRGMMSIFSIVLARIPLWGYGTFAASNSSYWTVGGAFNPGSPGGASQGPGTGAPWFYNSVWPYVYNTLTETWQETYDHGYPPTYYSGGTLTTTTPYSINYDVRYSTSSSGGPVLGNGTVTGFTITNSLITINYLAGYQTIGSNPLSIAYFLGTYTAQLSGSILDPTGIGPFNPLDLTHGWAAMTALAETMLATTAIPAIGANSQWTSLTTISTGSGIQTTNNIYNSDILWDDIFAAAHGMIGYYGQYQFMFPTIKDWPVPYVPGQPDNRDNGQNSGACLCAKSIWQLNGSGWGNNAVDPGINQLPPTGLLQVMNSHDSIYAQAVNLSNFTSAGSVTIDTNYPKPFAWPTTKTFNSSDVTAAIGSNAYGMIGFQSVAG